MRVSPSITLAGYFWLPAHPDKKLPGTLVVADGGKVQLDAIGSFFASAAAFTAPRTIERIVGHVEKHGYATLDDCIARDWSISLGGISRCSYHAHVLFLGVAFDEGEKPQFNALHFGAEGLNEWHSITGLLEEYNLSENTAAISYSRPDAIELWSEGDVLLSLRFMWVVPGSNSPTQATIRQESYLSLRSEKLQPLEFFLEYAHKLLHFLSFAVDETVSICDVSLGSSLIMEDGPGGKKYEHKISVFYESLSFRAKPAKVERHHLLFGFSAIRGRSSDVIGAWLVAHERLVPAMNLYFSAQAGAHSYLNSRFLSVSQAIETYHRRTFKETNLPPADFSALLQTLVKAAPGPHREMIESRLTYANEPSLRLRLRQLVGSFVDYFGDVKAQKAFIDLVVTTRNYFTHYDERLAEAAAHGQELWDLCAKLEALYQLQLMKEIGFSESMIAEVVKENRSLRMKLNLGETEHAIVISSRKLYFAYGSNMWRQQMQERCPEHRWVGSALLRGFRWIISKRGVANVVAASGSVVYGTLFEISATDEVRLDAKEKGYDKAEHPVESGGQTKPALMYIDRVQAEGLARTEYVARINNAIADANLPPDYVAQQIRKFIPASNAP